jgi:hypothetical protein
MSHILERECELIWDQKVLQDEVPLRYGFTPDWPFGSASADMGWRTMRWTRDRDAFTVYVTRKKNALGWDARVRIVTDTGWNTPTEVKMET